MTLFIEKYIESKPNFKKELYLLHEVLQSFDLQVKKVDSEPLYFKNDIPVLGFRAFEDHYVLWFKNDYFSLDNSLIINNLKGFLGVLPLRFSIDNKMDLKLVKSNVLAALERIECEQNLKEAIQDTESYDFEEYLKNLSKGKRFQYAEYLASLNQILQKSTSSNPELKDVKNKNV